MKVCMLYEYNINLWNVCELNFDSVEFDFPHEFYVTFVHSRQNFGRGNRNFRHSVLKSNSEM